MRWLGQSAFQVDPYSESNLLSALDSLLEWIDKLEFLRELFPILQALRLSDSVSFGLLQIENE